MLNLTQKLISFDSTQSEIETMKFIESYIKDIFWDTLIYQKQDIGHNQRYNLIIKNTEHPDVILAWHVDTVPEFSKEQFIPRIQDDKLYGRGAVDMKAGVAINITLIDFMLKNKIKFWVLCYADEEYHFRGMEKFVQEYTWKIHPKLTIVTESTNTKIYTWFRGIASISLEIKWKSAHSARKHLWINAISEYVYFIDHLEKHIQSKDIDGYQSLTNLAWIHGGIQQDWNIIRQDNIVPNIAKGEFSIRLGNKFTQQELEIFMKDYFDKKWIEIISTKIKVRCNPMIQTGLKEKYEEYGEVEEGYTFGYSDIQFVKDSLGGDCLLIWPSPNEKSHQADEYVDIESMSKAKNIIEKILQDFIANKS